MKRNIAIVAGGDTSEIVVSLRSAQGIYSFIDKEKYNLYIVEMEGRRWEVQLPDGKRIPVDRNDFSFTDGTERWCSILPISPFMVHRVRMAACKAIST